jgi:hypothetical protein
MNVAEKPILAPCFLTLFASLPGLFAATNQSADAASTQATAPARLTVGGERFTLRRILDHRLNDAVAFTFGAPEKWRDSSQVFWEFGNINMPVTWVVTAENPSNEEAFFMFEPSSPARLAGPPPGGALRDRQVISRRPAVEPAGLGNQAAAHYGCLRPNLVVPIPNREKSAAFFLRKPIVRRSADAPLQEL